MGFVHHVEGPPPPTEVALRLPMLSDRAVADTLHLADGYREVRSALLALSGISLMHNLGLGSPSSLVGVVVTARESLERAEEALVGPAASAREGVQRRAIALSSAVVTLDEQAAALVADGHTVVDSDALHSVQRILARTAVPDAGLRHFTSVSCAGYPAARHEHDQHGSHEHVHTHAH